MKRLALLTIVAATLATVAVATAGSASGQAQGGRTIQLRESGGGLSAVDLPPRARSRKSPPSRGDMVVFTKRLVTPDAKAAGTLHSVCVVTVPRRSIETATMQCNGTIVLRDGTLAVETALAIGSANVATLAVTGGTGAYEGARGSMVSRESGDGAAGDTIHLLG